MRRLLACLFVLGSATGACASLDYYTGYLFGQPLNRLDNLVLNSQKTMEALFERPGTTDSVARRLFDEAVSKKPVRIERTTAVFDFDTNTLQLFIIAREPVPTGEDCAALLEAARDRLIRSAIYATMPLEIEERKKGASYLVSELLLSPSKVEAKGGPSDLVDHVTKLTSVHVTIDQTDNVTKYVACSGSLAGTDVDLKIR